MDENLKRFLKKNAWKFTLEEMKDELKEVFGLKYTAKDVQFLYGELAINYYKRKRRECRFPSTPPKKVIGPLQKDCFYSIREINLKGRVSTNPIIPERCIKAQYIGEDEHKIYFRHSGGWIETFQNNANIVKVEKIENEQEAI